MANSDQLRDLLSQQNYAYHTIVVRAKVDDYMGNNGGGDEIRFKYQAIRVAPVDFKEENEMLLKRLEMYMGKAGG